MLLALGGCAQGAASGQGTDQSTTTSPPMTPAGSGVTSIGPPVTSEVTSGATPDAATATVTAPDTRGLPAGLSAGEQRYIARNAPAGVSAAAVLQSGQDTCARIQRVAATSPDAVVVAIISGQLAAAHDAITYLCPDRRPLLVASAGGFADGDLVVGRQTVAGSSVAPGSYRARQPTSACRWSVTTKDRAVIAEGSGSSTRTVRIPATAAGFSSTGCVAWSRG